MATINGDWFRTKLTSKGRSQRALAKHLKLDAAAVTLMLNGRRRMQLDEAHDIASFLGEPVSAVLRAAGLPMSGSSDDKANAPLTGTPLQGLRQKRDQLQAEVDALNKAIDILEK